MNSKLRNILLLVVILCSSLYSQNNGKKTGTSSFTWLKISPTARGTALGGTFIGLSDDASTLYYNPAGMIKVDNPEFIASYNMWYDESPHVFAGAVLPLKSISGAVGFQFSYLSSGDMDETTPFKPLGTGRTFQANYLMAGVSYAQMLTSKFYVGGTAKFLYGAIADETAVTGAVDIGTYYNTQWKSLIFGMSMRNFGGTVQYIDDENDLPMEFVFGVSLVPYEDGMNKVSTLLEAAHPNDNDEYLMFGVEYSYNNMFFVRAGRKLNGTEWSLMKEDQTNEVDTDITEADDGINLAGTSCGFGIDLRSVGIKIDYGYMYHEELGHTNTVTFGYSLK